MRIPIQGNGKGINPYQDNHNFNGGLIEKQKMYLNSEALLKYFLGTDDHIDTLIKCKGSEIDLWTYDYNLYEALGSIKSYDDFKLGNLVKLLEVVKVLPYEDYTDNKKKILSYNRVEELRKKALSNNKGNNGGFKQRES